MVQARVYPSFRSMKRLVVFLLPLDRMLVHCRVTPSIKCASTHLYTWVERGTVGVKCLAQEHNTVSLAMVQTWTSQSRDKRTNHEASPPQQKQKQQNTSLSWILKFKLALTRESWRISREQMPLFPSHQNS